ncbi:HD domain-containing phosphohydrolase [Nitrospinota bacterium]
MSELGDLQKFQEAPAQAPDLPDTHAAEEEVPLAPPSLPETRRPAPVPETPAPPSRAPAEEQAAASPFAEVEAPPARAPAREEAAASPFAEEEAPPPEEDKPKRPRRSVLLGPDVDDDEGEAGQENEAEINPYSALRERALQFLYTFLQSVSNQESFPLDDAEDVIYDCIEDPDALEHLYSLAVSAKDTSNSMAIHLFNHTVYALKLGKGLKWSPDRLVRLGVASLIHDIGMCAIPQKIRHKEGKLTPAELTEIRNHPHYGMEIILQIFGNPFQWLAEAIYQEHERENGRGYPQGLSGSQISEYAKVIGLADIYEALTHHRPHRKRMLPHKAVQEIVQTQKALFHQRLLKVMIEELSVFSLNSLVRLNSNAIGRVAETTPGQPLRPVVQLIFDADGNEIMEDRYISLKEFPLLYIVDEVEESELPSNL